MAEDGAAFTMATPFRIGYAFKRLAEFEHVNERDVVIF